MGKKRLLPKAALVLRSKSIKRSGAGDVKYSIGNIVIIMVRTMYGARRVLEILGEVGERTTL